MKTQDLLVTNPYLLNESFAVGLLLLEALLKNSKYLTHLVQTFISFAHFTSPLCALIESILLISDIVHRGESMISLLQEVAIDINSLLVAMQQVLPGLTIKLTKTLHNLILAG